MSGGSLKKFKVQLQKAFPNLSADDVDNIMPKKAIVTIDKLSNKKVVYWIEKEKPLFFDNSNGKGDLFPSVYLMWQYPHILPPLVVHHQVSKYILCGADVMAPGVVFGLEGNFHMGEKRAVICMGNPAPVCVGQLAFGSNSVETDKGKALIVVHRHQDFLWSSGDQSIPNDGYMHDKVLPILEDESLIQQLRSFGMDVQIEQAQESIDEDSDMREVGKADDDDACPEEDKQGLVGQPQPEGAGEGDAALTEALEQNEENSAGERSDTQQDDGPNMTREVAHLHAKHGNMLDNYAQHLSVLHS